MADAIRVGTEIRDARVMAGLSLAEVGTAVGLSPSQVSRIERARAPTVTVGQFGRIGAVVGLDVRLRAYPGGDPVRDAAQMRLLERVRGRLCADLRFRTEVPLPMMGDQRAWDGWIDGLQTPPGPSLGLPVEAETRITDFQAQTRRLVLKMRDGSAEHVLVVVSDTRSNRAALISASAAVRELFPVTSRRALQALAVGIHPGGSALIVL
jgi:transcriptional regulator with XRE-family HTH domain